VKKKNFWHDDRVDFLNRYYTVESKADDDYDRYYESTSSVYEHGDIDFEKVETYNAVFLDEEDCQKYCDWKNAQELKKMSE
jgi:hypothetical protein